MPTFHIPPTLDMHYEVDDYTDPWRPPATVLMLHGNAESGAAWYGWYPTWRPGIGSCAQTCAASGPPRPCRGISPGPWISSLTTSAASWIPWVWSASM